MAMNSVASLSSTITGRVVCVNPKGFKLEGHDDWLNWSRYATSPVAPEKGETITVVVDKQGFVRHVEGSVATNGHAPARIDAQGRSGGTDKDRTITRLACLKAAADFASSRHDLKSGEVLRIAESFERWVNRPADAPDLTDAF